MRRLAGGLAVALAAVAAGCGGGGGSKSSTPGPGSGDRGREVHTTTTRVEVVKGLGSDGRFDPATIYKKESPGVVTVISLFDGGGLGAILGGGGGGGGGGDAGLGSGFVLDAEGEIATNAHVVTTGSGARRRKATQVYVAFADGNRVAATVRGFDPNADVALLQIDPKGLTLDPLPLGQSSKVRVGSPVAAMGSPFGEEQSLSVGVVSAVDRNVASLTRFDISDAIQTDAAINPGNSGGPLVDERGRVIGLNQQIQTRSGGGEGVGFAVPIDLARRSIAQLRRTGRVDYAYIGVASQAVYPQAAAHFHLPTDRGAWIQDVTPGGPGARAGIRGGGSGERAFQAATFKTGGDIVVAVDGRPIRDPNDLSDTVGRHRPGDRVRVVVFRGSAKRTLNVTLGRRPLTAATG